MSTSGVPDRATRAAPSRGSPRPASTPDAHRATLPYIGVAIALVFALTLVDLIRHARGTRSHRRADGVPTRAGAEGHQRGPAADGKEPTGNRQEPANRQGTETEGPAPGVGLTTTLPAPSYEPLPQPWEWTARRRMYVAAQASAALALIAVALAPPVQDLAERDVRVHHLEHAALLGGGGILGLVLGLTLRPPGHRLPWERFPIRRRVALGLVLLGPLVVMAAMVPSTSAWIDSHPLAHELEHLALIFSGGVIGFSARLFSTALGWLVVALIAAMAAAFGGMALAHPLGLLVAGGGVIMASVQGHRV